MAAPLRKVMERQTRSKGSTLTTSAGTVTWTAHYETVWHLECGHQVIGPHSAPDSVSKRCKGCEGAS